MIQEQQKKLIQIINAGFKAFHYNGYKLTQMNDIASKMNGSVGSIYSYVRGKKALFDLCLLEAFVENFLNTITGLPFTDIDHDMLLSKFIKPALKQHSATQKNFYKSDPTLDEVIIHIFAYITKYWKGIKMLDSSAKEWPLLYKLYMQLRKESYENLTEYMIKGVENETIRPLKNIPLSARLLVENIAYFAMHRRYDMLLNDMNENEALELTLDAMVHAYQGK